MLTIRTAADADLEMSRIFFSSSQTRASPTQSDQWTDSINSCKKNKFGNKKQKYMFLYFNKNIKNIK